MNSQSLATRSVGHKHRLAEDDSMPQIPAQRRKLGRAQTQEPRAQLRKSEDSKKPGAILLSSPSDVADVAVLVQPQKIRTRQAKTSGLPNLEMVTKVDPELSDVDTQVEAEALTPRPSVRRRAPRRPPLSRRWAVGPNRARFGVGIVRCRSWRLNGEETETEDESPAPSPRSKTASTSASFSVPVSAMDFSSCQDENVEDQVGASVLPVDPSQNCFDRSFSEDQWQLRSPSPDGEFVPENSCCGGKSVEKGEEEQGELQS